ncbi:MAG TPA: asparagine synthase (glutamine-hydrolyzing) [Flavipsychrobacter sp.]|nr:asparagine synthase (glutamine-hydrolyzing) [Flavipsychrobacter sp.]
MCGIAGGWGNISVGKLKEGLRRLEHRGPDGEGFFSDADEQIYLGHRRLSILDTSSAGSQPFFYEGLAIVYNGEIYNFLEIRTELRAKGFTFKTETDTEVILAAYRHWGVGCLEKFNGMWSFVIWDKDKQECFISRDRFGKKPLFYSFYKKAFLFASEMKAITPSFDEVTISEDFDWCKNNMFRYEVTDKCLIKNIKRFPAGSYAILKKNEKVLHPIRFWDTRKELVSVPARYEDQVEAFRELFINACAIRMRSDVPIGTALSGGLDSSAVMCTIAHIARNRKLERSAASWQHAFVACFKGTPLDERPYAEQVVNHLNIPADYLEIDPVKGVDSLNDYLYFFEELYLTSPIPMIELYRNIKKNGVTVSIDGHGADELMAGYRSDITRALLDAGLNLRKIKQILGTYQGMFSDENAQETKPGIGFGEWKTQMNVHLNGRKNIARYILKELTGNNKKENLSKAEFGNYNGLLYELFHETVLPTLLRNYDRYAMAGSVETRMPFMDHRLVSFTFSLPWESKLKNGFTKSLIRDAARPYMPESIVNRKSKVGFNTPIVDWMRGPWRTFLLDTISSKNFQECGLINREETKAAVNKVLTVDNPHFFDGEHAWYLLLPYFWEQAVLKRKTDEISAGSPIRL